MTDASWWQLHFSVKIIIKDLSSIWRLHVLQSNNIHLKLRNINWSICLQQEVSEPTTNHRTREIFWRDVLSIYMFTFSNWIYLHLLLYFTSEWTRGILTETACFKLTLDMFAKIWSECVNTNIQNETGEKKHAMWCMYPK